MRSTAPKSLPVQVEEIYHHTRLSVPQVGEIGIFGNGLDADKGEDVFRIFAGTEWMVL